MTLEDDLLTLAALDRQVVRAVVQSDTADLKIALRTYGQLRADVRKVLLAAPAVVVANVDAVQVLRKITTGDGLETDRIIDLLSSISETDERSEFSDSEIKRLGSELFYSWFSHHEYIAGLAELRPLAVSASVAESVSRLVRQVKDCYAFQQYDAAYGLCRAVIEASVRDICVKRKLFPELGDNVILFEEFKWSQLRDKVSTGDLRERLRLLYSELCTVLHARKSVGKSEALHAFEETLQVVEHLYAANGL